MDIERINRIINDVCTRCAFLRSIRWREKKKNNRDFQTNWVRVV